MEASTQPVEAEEARTVVIFGNSNPQMTHDVLDEEGNKIGQVQRAAKHLDQSETRVEMWPGFDDDEFVKRTLSTDNDRQLKLVERVLGPEHQKYAVGVHECDQIVGVHHGGDKPDWVSSSDPAFAKALGHFFDCPVADEPPSMVLTNAGRDALHAQHIGTSTQPAAFFYGALSANSGSGFGATDTTLAGEITTAGGGLVRGSMTYAHTTGTNTSTLTKTWTANGSDSLPVTVASWANFNASSSGTMAEEDALNTSATLNISGDSLTVTFTLTAG